MKNYNEKMLKIWAQFCLRADVFFQEAELERLVQEGPLLAGERFTSESKATGN